MNRRISTPSLVHRSGRNGADSPNHLDDDSRELAEDEDKAEGADAE